MEHKFRNQYFTICSSVRVLCRIRSHGSTVILSLECLFKTPLDTLIRGYNPTTCIGFSRILQYLKVMNQSGKIVLGFFWELTRFRPSWINTNYMCPCSLEMVEKAGHVKLLSRLSCCFYHRIESGSMIPRPLVHLGLIMV